MDGQAGWWTTSGNIGLPPPPLERVMGVSRQQQQQPFGLKVLSEIFQIILLDIFYNLDGVICIADDVLIFGKTKEEHDANLVKFISTCKRVGIQLN